MADPPERGSCWVVTLRLPSQPHLGCAGVNRASFWPREGGALELGAALRARAAGSDMSDGWQVRGSEQPRLQPSRNGSRQATGTKQPRKWHLLRGERAGAVTGKGPSGSRERAERGDLGRKRGRKSFTI